MNRTGVVKASHIHQPRLFEAPPRGRAAVPSDKYHPNSLARWSDGGAFDYECSERIFLGRTGVGPLRVAWDTNVLIDWVEYGRQLMDEPESLPRSLDDDYRVELHALAAIINLSFTRDVRVRVSARQLRDGKLSRVRNALRDAQLTQIHASTACTCDEPPRKHVAKRRVLRMRPSFDRLLVEDAIASGCHVFLSRDEDDVLCAVQHIAEFGMVAMKPSELFDALTECGEAQCPFGVDHMVCDNHKFVHLLGMLDQQA